MKKYCFETQKVCHRNKGDALNSLCRKGKVKRPDAYICPACGYWHLTSHSENRGSYRKNNNLKR